MTVTYVSNSEVLDSLYRKLDIDPQKARDHYNITPKEDDFANSLSMIGFKVFGIEAS